MLAVSSINVGSILIFPSCVIHRTPVCRTDVGRVDTNSRLYDNNDNVRNVSFIPRYNIIYYMFSNPTQVGNRKNASTLNAWLHHLHRRPQ